MASKNKFYVVWKGLKPGIYRSWAECQKQIREFQGAQYMGFSSEEAAKKAFKGSYQTAQKEKKKASEPSEELKKRLGEPNYNSIAVDAAASGNPGKMEYQGVDTRSGKRLFHQGPFEQGTNNIGEFLAIVHGLAFLKKKGSSRIIYTDSRTAISWVKKKRCNTKLVQTEANESLFELVHRAEAWLRNNSYSTKIVKWETRAWGEIPADFGRK